MTQAVLVSMPGKLEAEKIAGWLSGLVRGAHVAPAQGEWGIYVPAATLPRARAALKRVISNPARGGYRVCVKHADRPYHCIRRTYRTVGQAAVAADAFVKRRGALKALALDRKGKVHFVAFDRRRVRGNPLTRAETAMILRTVRHQLEAASRPWSKKEDKDFHAGRAFEAARTAYAYGHLSKERLAKLWRKAHSANGARSNPAKLLSLEAARSLPPLYSQEKVADPVARVKFFTPWSNWTWFALEFDTQDQFFGLVQGQHEEMGYFSLSELMRIRGPGGLRIERDLYFKPTPISQLRRKALANRRAPRRNHGGNGHGSALVLVVMGRHIPVRNWSEASNAVSVIRDRSGFGYSKMGSEFPIYQGRRIVAHVSYNGKVWAGAPQPVKPGWKPGKLLYSPYGPERNARPAWTKGPRQFKEHFVISIEEFQRAIGLLTPAERKEYEGMIGRGFPERAVHWVLTKYRKAVQPNRRRRAATRRNPDGREYIGYAKLEGIPVRIAAEYWADRWKVWAYPTREGKQTTHYRDVRMKLGDDWDFDITDTYAELGKLPRGMQERIADLTMPGWRTRTNARRRGVRR